VRGGAVSKEERMKRLLIWLLAAIAVCAPLVASAQVTTALVQGRVSDESGAPVPGAAITARNTATSAARAAISDAQGLYRIAGLPVGPYEISAAMNGFGTHVRSGITLRIGQEANVDFGLKVAAVSETVTIVGEAPIVETTKTALGKTITTKQIDDLPVGGRTFQNLAFLSPGILVNASTGGTGIAASGGTGRNNTLLIDGLSNDDDSVASDRGNFPLDAVQELQVLANQYSAEFGQASGAVINALTRSGTNKLHGRAYFYYRSDGLSANNPFVQPDPATGKAPKAPFKQKIPGGFLSGPLQKDKTFFFVSYEHALRDETAVISVPAATLAALGQPSQTNFPNAIRNPRLVGKVDHHLTPAQTLTVRYRLDRDTRDNWYVGGAGNPDGRSTIERGTDRLIKNQDIALSHTWVASPRALNELRTQFARRTLDWSVDNYCKDCPTINRPGVLLGKANNMPQGRTEDRLQIQDSFSYNVSDKAGDHFFKFGADASFIDLTSTFYNNLHGTFTFTTDRPFNAADRTTYPIQFTKNTGDPTVQLNNNIYGAFVQDQWKVTPHFTLNLGLRYDYEDVVGIKQDHNNFGPRVHFAWDPFKDGKTALRGGFGRYFDQVFLNIPLNAENAKKFVGVTIANPGFPDPFVGGSVATPPPPSTVVFDPALTTPFGNTFSLGFQREIFRDLAVTVDGVYAQGEDLLVTLDQNYSINGSIRPNPNFAIMRMVKSTARSRYKALQTGIEKRFSRRYSFSLAYTLADSKRNSEDFNFNPQDHRDLDAEYAPSFSDARHSVAGSVLFEAPLGIKLGMAGRYRSALPYNITTGRDDNRDGFPTTDRPAGTARNAGRGAAVWFVDARVAKELRLRGAQIEAIVQAFNVFNHPSMGGFIGNQLSAQFRKPTAVVTNFEPRQVELALRVGF
jgi:outer membrane receptor for ferrienterochelin and colicin